MQGKIIFFSESETFGKAPRDFEDARTEFGWSIMLDAEWYPISVKPNKRYDLGIVIIPKNNPKVDINHIRKVCDKVAVMQEGPHWLFQDYKMEQQIWWYNALTEFDMLFAHNHKDVNYYKGITNKPVHKMPTLMLTEKLGITSRTETLVDNYGDLPSPKAYDKDKVIIGGNMVRWYGGFDSYVVAQEFETPISAPSMGRKIDREDEMDINHFPYMTWVEWINNLSQFKYGVHLMPTHAAGTFTLNCAFHGIPCIGYEGLDTQEELHPHLTVKDGDIALAKQYAKDLKNDEDFYELCSTSSRENYQNSLYNEKNFVPHITEILEELYENN